MYELSSTLVKLGFQLNPYDACIKNAVIKGTLFTICWYVDDNKLSHADDSTDVIAKIEFKFGKLTVTYGCKHQFLRMEIIFNKKGTVAIGMSHYVGQAIEMFGETFCYSVVTPVTLHLFKIQDNDTDLDQKKAKTFHSMFSLLLYVSKHCRLNIQMAIASCAPEYQNPVKMIGKNSDK